MVSAKKPDLMHRAPAKMHRAQGRTAEKRLEDEGSNYREQHVTKGSMGYGEERGKGEQDCIIQGSVALLEFIFPSGSFGLFLNFFYINMVLYHS